MNILLWIIFGGVLGWIASLLARSNRNTFINIILGILSAIIGTLVIKYIGYNDTILYNLYILIITLALTILLIWLVKVIKKNIY